MSVSKDFTFTPAEKMDASEGLFRVELDSIHFQERSQFLERAGFLKNIVSFLGVALILIILAPLIFVISCVILIRSGRPIFYRQNRVGLNGSHFQMFKFRTMINGAHSMKNDLKHLNFMTGPFFKIKKDPRVTPEGEFLRKWSLDELPQLINVLKGEMALIGPRPMLPEEIQCLNCRDILSVKPGITGFWQVAGRNEVVDFRKKLAMDRFYIKRKSFSFDFMILFKTFFAVIRRRGAY